VCVCVVLSCENRVRVCGHESLWNGYELSKFDPLFGPFGSHAKTEEACVFLCVCVCVSVSGCVSEKK
jgi:hypothetical protein